VRSFKKEEIVAVSEHGLGWKAGRAQQENESRAGERPSEVPGARINQCWIPCVRRRTKRQALAHKTESRKRDKQKIIKKIPWLDAAVFACGNTKIKKLTWTKAREQHRDLELVRAAEEIGLRSKKPRTQKTKSIRQRNLA
jgi:hypothetical protein